MSSDPTNPTQPSNDPFAPPPASEPVTAPDPGGPTPPPNIPIITDVPEQLPEQELPTIADR